MYVVMCGGYEGDLDIPEVYGPFEKQSEAFVWLDKKHYIPDPDDDNWLMGICGAPPVEHIVVEVIPAE